MTKAEIDVKAMSDDELKRFVALAKEEIDLRERQRKDEGIAKIRAIAGEFGLSVSIDGARGRPGGRTSKKRAAPPVTDKVAAAS